MDSEGAQQFPFRTLSMLISIICILFFSFLARTLFLRHVLPPFLDVFQCFRDKEPMRADGRVTGEVNAAYVPDAGTDRITCTTKM